jgi:hypothetical protein
MIGTCKVRNEKCQTRPATNAGQEVPTAREHRTLNERQQFADHVFHDQLRDDFCKRLDSGVANHGLFCARIPLQQRKEQRQVLGAAHKLDKIAQLTRNGRDGLFIVLIKIWRRCVSAV